MPAILSSLPLLCSGGDSCQGFARLLGNPHTFSLKKKKQTTPINKSVTSLSCCQPAASLLHHL